MADNNEGLVETVLELPFSKWWPVLTGALSGITLRLIFSGSPGHAYAAMLASFIYFSPILVGATTIYFAEYYL